MSKTKVKKEVVVKPSAAAIKENNSTEGPKKSAAIQEQQAEKAAEQTPVGIDFTNPEQRKKEQDEAREQNEKDSKVPPAGVSIKK